MNHVTPPPLSAQSSDDGKPVRTSRLAIASLIFGILSVMGGALLIIPMILAVVFGHIAFAKTDKNRSLEGKGMALAGMILGYGSIFFGGLFAAMAIPAFQKVRENAIKRTMYNDARQIGSAAQQYMLETNSKSVTVVVDPATGKISGPLALYAKQITPGTRVIDGVVEQENGSFSLQNPRAYGGAVKIFTSEGEEK